MPLRRATCLQHLCFHVFNLLDLQAILSLDSARRLTLSLTFRHQYNRTAMRVPRTENVCILGYHF